MNKISVIIPIYNAERYLKRTFSCFLNQDYENYELVAVNDNSTDCSEAIIQSFIPMFREKGVELKLVNRVENGGLCAALNSGLECSTGQYLCFPDADDEVDEKYLSSMINVLRKENSKWVRCNYEIVLDDENRGYDVILPTVSVYKNDFFDFISKYIPHNAWNMLVEKEYFLQCVGEKLYDSRLTQEWSILLPLAYKSNYSRCQEKLYRYHIKKHAMSGWRNGDIASVIEHIDALEKLNRLIIDRIENMAMSDKRVAYKALSIYYHMLKSRKYSEKEIYDLAEFEERKVYELGGEFIDSVEVKNKIHDADMFTRIAFDKLLEANLSVAVHDYKFFKGKIIGGYRVVYDKGGKEIIEMLANIYGEPVGIWNYESFDKTQNTTPIMCLIQNSKVYREFTNRYSDEIFLEYRQLRNSIRGWAAGKEAKSYVERIC
ncbi:MAG: glycosyltransferase [Lachnospiraceae bacterium]|nr:glycosyltransferase [Lachnospiraceae bacterium]